MNLSFGFKPLRFKEHFDEALQQPNEVIAAGAMPREERSGWCKDSRNEFESQSFKPKTQVMSKLPTIKRKAIPILKKHGV